MIPLELKRDENGLLYTDNIELVRYHSLDIDHREDKYKRLEQNEFYPFRSTDDYIIKFNWNGYKKKKRIRILEMLEILISKQKNVSSVDFPIGYFLFLKKVQGLIVKYYKNGESFENILKGNDIEALGKYYTHDEDNIRNLFMLFDDIMTLEYEMFENGIYYRDFNPGNIILTENTTKIIDFDPNFVRFNDKDQGLKDIMMSYQLLLKEVLALKYKLVNDIVYVPKNFEDAKVYTKKLENEIRKR